MSKKLYLVGQRFGRLLVLEPAGTSKHNKTQSLCRCDCGTEKVILNSHLLNGNTKSCECLSRDITSERRFIHGFTVRNNGKKQTRSYTAWINMKMRCTNKYLPQAKDYMGRGIRACKRYFGSCAAIVEDIGECPPNLEIDRWPNNDGHYSCGRCEECLSQGWAFNIRWATVQEQARNRRTNRVVTVRGLTDCLIALTDRFCVPYHRTKARLRAGWTPEDAFFKSPQRARS